MANTQKMRGSAAMEHNARARIMQEARHPTQNLYLLFSPLDLTNLMAYLYPQRQKMSKQI